VSGAGEVIIFFVVAMVGWVLCRAWQERALCVLLLSERLIVVADRARQAELVIPIVRPEWK